MRNTRAVIFDMDGVIINSEPIHIEAEKFVLDKYNIVPTEKDWQSFKGQTSINIFSQVINKYALKNISAEDMADQKINKFIQLIEESNDILFDGFIDLVGHLSFRYDLALTTSSHSKIQNAFFERFGLYKHFKVIVTGDMVIRGKPDPEPYLKTIEKIGLPANSCVVVEDSVNGILSAKKAGAYVVAVTHTFPRDMLFRADRVCDSLLEVSTLL